ncbi:cytochrome C assembly family protein [Verrucomicrobiota bacterium sgz303538]
MDRLLLVISTFCFLFGFAYTMHALGARVYRRSRLNLCFMLTGFVFQTAFLYLRGQAVGRCPLTNLFEVLIFLCWSMVLFYLLIGPAYRLSLLGAFTSPFVFVLQLAALLLPPEPIKRVTTPPNAWLELHAALSIVAYGAFALACVAGVMYLAQERQLKTHQIRSIFYHLPPIHDLAVANRRLIFTGFALLTVGLVSGFAHGSAHVHVMRFVSIGVWSVYGFILVALLWHRISPRRVALLSVAVFSVMLITLWGVQAIPKQTAF